MINGPFYKSYKDLLQRQTFFYDEENPARMKLLNRKKTRYMNGQYSLSRWSQFAYLKPDQQIVF